jgi:hypothetical protein
MRELDELTREITRGKLARAPRAVPQIAGSLRRESRLLGVEWDNLAIEAQREEIVLRISELESQCREGGRLPADVRAALRDEIASLSAILSTRKEDVAGILASNVSRLREFTRLGTRVSHLQKQQIKTDMLSMKAEITFLEQGAGELENLARIVECFKDEDPLESEGKNWDLWFEANYNRR